MYHCTIRSRVYPSWCQVSYHQWQLKTLENIQRTHRAALHLQTNMSPPSWLLNGLLSLESAINCQNWCVDILLKDFPLRHYMWYLLPALSTFARRQGALLHSMYLLTPETLFCKVRVSRKQSILQLIIQHFRFIYILCDISFYNM